MSVVVTSYNKHELLKETIESIFDKQLEIIIVDDASNLETNNILESLVQKYPTIKLIKLNHNVGVSQARNLGLENSSRKYITFLDGDDLGKKNGYKKLCEAAEKYSLDIVIGDFRCFNDYREWKLPYMSAVMRLTEKNLTIKDYPELALSPSVCNKIYNRKYLIENKIIFNSKLNIGEDLLFNAYAFQKSSRIRVVTEEVLKYRVRHADDSLTKIKLIDYILELEELQKNLSMNFKKQENEAFLKRQLNYFFKLFNRENSQLIKEDEKRISLILNSLNNFFEYSHSVSSENTYWYSKLLKSVVTNKDLFTFKKIIEELNSNSSREYISDNGVFVDPFALKISPIYKKDLTFNKMRVISRIERANLNKKNELTLGGYAYLENLTMNNKVIYLKVINTVTRKIKYIETKVQKRTDITFLNSKNRIDYNNSGFLVENLNIEKLGEGTWEFSLVIKQDNESWETPIVFQLAEVRNMIKPKNHSSYIEPIFKNTLSFKISSKSMLKSIKFKLNTIKSNLKYEWSLLVEKDYKTLLIIQLYRLFNRFLKNRNVWLIGERKDTAQDNSFHLFKFLRENEKQINAYYVIDKSSIDYQKIKKLRKIIPYNSIRHTLYLLLAQYTINSYLDRANMYTESYKKIMKKYPEWNCTDKVFLQHGVIGFSRVNHSLHKNRTLYDKFLVSSEFEKSHIVKEYGYKESEIINCGLPRWDALTDNYTKRTILLMPTWRNWIKNEKELLESEYWTTYISFLENKKLHDYLEKNNVHLSFYPHYQMQKLLQNQKNVFHPHINLVKQGEETVQSLLIKHEILITDYSTVSFDFSYMNKKTIFFQFDFDEFYSRHYNLGVINHSTELFGPRVKTIEELINTLITDFDNHEYNRKVKKYLTKKESHSSCVIKELKDFKTNTIK